MNRTNGIFVLLLSAGLLAACGGRSPIQVISPGVIETPAAAILGSATPLAGLLNQPTATATLPVAPSPSPTPPASPASPGAGTGAQVVTVIVTATALPVPATATAPVPAEAAAATSTPSANIPLTGLQGGCVANRVDELEDLDVFTPQGLKIGEVKGLLVQRDVTAMASPFSQLAPPQVTYLIVNFDELPGLNDLNTLVPLKAFKGFTLDSLTPDCNLVLILDPSILATAPNFNEEIWPNFAALNIDQAYNTFWISKGLAIPTTGANGHPLGRPVGAEGGLDSIPARNLNGQNIGEIEDFVFDPQTGVIQYAVLDTSDIPGVGEKSIPVPITRVVWVNDPMDGIEGHVVLDVPDTAWMNAPYYTDLDMLNPTVSGWDNQIKAYWQTVQ